MAITIDTSKIVTGWKTTANGLLALGITIILALQASGAAVMSTKTAAYLSIGLAVCRAMVGLIEQDAGKVPAITPEGKVTSVDSHETPDDPANVPVK
jgi:hypothetical protein